MKYTLLKSCLFACVFLFQFPLSQAQDGSALATEKEEEGPKFRFNGLGRTILAQTGIDGNILEADSSTIRNLTDGEFLLDLAMNATPNDVTEVQAILRLRNEFGGFFGSGMSVEVRELWARGIIANTLRYRVGDMDVVMSPYTLYNPEEEGSVNEPAVFLPQKEVINYEQFYTDENTRRLQGAKLDFGLDFANVLYDADVSGFIARVRGTDFFTIPTRFVTGGNAQFSTQTFSDSLGLKADFGLNVVHTFDDLQSGEAVSGIRNTVYTFNFDVSILDTKKMGLHLIGETGQSNLEFREDSVSVFKENDSFLDIGAKLVLKPQKITVSASFVDVGPDFFSIGAQSKRIDFDADKSYYNRLGKDNFVRTPGLFDITRDRALYTFQLSDRLMSYDPRFSNTMPYGTATPNRTGIRFGINHGGSDEILEIGINGALLSEIRGQGTFELKSFTLLRGSANVNFHNISSWEKTLRLTLGYQYEAVNRGGLEVEIVNLTSNLIEVGLEAELFTNFDILLGAKLLSAEGREYVPRIDEFNDVKDFPAPYDANDTEQLLAAGLKYEFKKDVYLTLQYQTFSSKIATDNTNDYNLNQIFVLYNMNF
ncbi:MAG: hypothetical protein KDC34_16935 [Saprospiraceae bacterium]|nr:hypothetical protein [Saprospiraceae bacterium]